MGKHGDSVRNDGKRTSEYMAWQGMLSRCRNPNYRQYADYGGRGISVCDRWLIYENFLADVGRKPSPDLTIDRINNDGNYEPGNVQWASRKTQSRNRRNNVMVSDGTTSRCLSEWTGILGVSRDTLRGRVRLGWNDHDVLFGKKRGS